jgi:Berberine and berberine like
MTTSIIDLAGLEDEARVRATYGVNFGRLVEVKQKYDPDNLFRVNRNICRPDGRSASAGREEGSHGHSATSSNAGRMGQHRGRL